MNRLPFLSESARRGLLVLEWLVVLIIFGIWIFSSHDGGSGSSQNGASGDSSYFRRRSNVDTRQHYSYSVEEEPVETFPFDPNEADSTALLRLGLAPWQVRAIYRYRAKHGRYHTVEDFKRLPGMTNEMWDRLAPYVRIGKQYQYVDVPDCTCPAASPAVRESSTSETTQPVVTRDTVLYPEKYKPGTLVDLNSADTNQLKKIPQIGSARSRKIVIYRQKLGGFVRAEQVMEACELPDEVLEWFVVNQPRPQRLNVNKLSVQRLMQHPYITFYQARAIVEYRKAKGDLHSFDELLKLEGFTQDKVDRLRDYVEF